MPAIKRDGLSKSGAWRAMRERGDSLADKNDCVVIALALAAKITYDEAREICAHYGRKEGKGVNRIEWQAFFKVELRERGIKMRRVDPKTFIARYPKPHCNALKSVTTHHPDRFHDAWKDGQRYLFISKGHVCYVEDGLVHDWSRGRALRCHEIFILEEDA